MEGYGPASYGDAIADVYDDWHPAGPASADAVDALAELARGGPVLELGCGTGRLALPLAERGLAVTGIDASGAMLARLAQKDVPAGLTVRLDDMARFRLDGSFELVFVAFNTFFNLPSAAEQSSCLAAVAAHLRADGRFVLECFVPPDPFEGPPDAVEVRALTAERVTLRVSRVDPAAQTVSGQNVELTESGVRLRPWFLRYASPAELDRLAAAAGLSLEARWADWRRSPFGPAAAQHVSVYRLGTKA